MENGPQMLSFSSFSNTLLTVCFLDLCCLPLCMLVILVKNPKTRINPILDVLDILPSWVAPQPHPAFLLEWSESILGKQGIVLPFLALWGL